MAVELNMDIDTMRDVYMTPSQRQAYDRILARALEQREAATPPRDVPQPQFVERVVVRVFSGEKDITEQVFGAKLGELIAAAPSGEGG